jgi:4-amino-4-deoxy-L-arabinose transferase-like glycosyltransferase
MSVAKLARSPLVWVLILALAVRLGAGLWWQSRLPPGARFAFPDSESYWNLAGTIARGEPYEFGTPPALVFRTPGYPLILSTLFFASGREPPVTAALALNAALGALTVLGVYAVARRLFDHRTGLVAAALVALYPGAIGTSVFILSEAAFCPLLMAQLLATTLAWQSAGTKATIALAVAAGCCAGAATLVRPSWLLFVPFALIVGVCSARDVRRHLLCGLCSFVGLAIVMAPWWARNERVTGHFVATTLQVGASLYDGLNPRATGASDMSFVPEFVALEEEEPADGESFEYRLDRRLRQASLEWAETHPGRVLQLAVIKFVRMWNLWPNESEFRSWPMRVAVAATYVPLLLLGLRGAIRFTPRGWPYALCWLPAIYLTLMHMIFVSSLRYREPAMLPLVILAAAAVVFYVSRGSQGTAPEITDRR